MFCFIWDLATLLRIGLVKIKFLQTKNWLTSEKNKKKLQGWKKWGELMVVLILQLWKNEITAPLTLKSGTLIDKRHRFSFFSCIFLIYGLVLVFLWPSGFYSKKVEEPSARDSQISVAYVAGYPQHYCFTS